MARRKEKRNRANGEGTLEKRGKYWLARWTVNGKHYSKSTHCSIRTDAEKKLAEFVRPFQISDEIEQLEFIKSKIAVKENQLEEINLEKYNCEITEIENKLDSIIRHTGEVTESTFDTYVSRLKSFLKWLNDSKHKITKVNEITEYIADDYLTHLSSKVSSTSWNFQVLLLKRIWNVCKFKNNVWNKFKLKRRVNNSERRELTLEEIKKIADYIKDDKEMTMLFMLGIYTGIRKGDLANLRWENIDYIRNEIKILPMKTKRNGKWIIVPIHKVLKDALLKFKKVDDEFVLPTIRNLYITQLLHHRIRRIFKACGITTSRKDEFGRNKTIVSFHSLRHTFVSIAANSGIPLLFVQQIVGHTNSDMTLKYYHQNSQQLQSAVASLPSIKFDDKNDIDNTRIKRTIRIDTDVYNMILENLEVGESIDQYLRRKLSR
jgi:integrase